MGRMVWWLRGVPLLLTVMIATVLPARGEKPATPPPAPEALDPTPQLGTLGRVHWGDRLRLEGQELGRLEGELVGARGDTLVLRRDTSMVSVPLASAERVWVDRSAGVKGAKTGALIGGIAGGLAAGTQYLLLTRRWYNDPPDEYGLGRHLAFVTMGAISSGIAGGLIGALIGASTRTWEPLYRPRAPTSPGSPRPEGPVPRRSRPMGNARLYGGAAWTPVKHTTGTSLYLKLNLYATPWRRFAFGPEIGGSTASLGHEWASTASHETGEDPLLHACVNGRFTPFSGTLQPYLFVSPGYYYWSTHYVGIGVGAGLDFTWGKRAPMIGFECAWHEPLSDPGEFCSLQILTTSVGVRFASW
jgi:hypothetical protein